MYVMTVVPEPEVVMEELERVCAPGGQVILVNHFSQDHGTRGWLERRMAPFASTLGWRPIFPVDRVMGCENLELVERRSLRPLGLFTMLRFTKAAAPKIAKGRSRAMVSDNYISEAVVSQ
jgi:phosphatidylethanolamine/phosphatidyl-N-methylethanolamine N-methyltransferase